MFLPLLLKLMVTNSTASFFIGTYTSPTGSQGIYHSTLDLQTGVIQAPTLSAQANNPSFLAADQYGRYLFAVNEIGQGIVDSFEINPDATLKFLNHQSSKGAAPCHISIGPNDQCVFVANYSDGTFARLPINGDGSLGPSDWSLTNKGKGPNAGRQEGPHAHSAYYVPALKAIVMCDLGTDEVLATPSDSPQANPTRIHVKPGTGPRHAAISHDGKFAYVNGELLNTVSVFQIRDRFDWKQLQSVETLPDGSGSVASFTAEIALHPSGQWLYVSNRGHDTIAVYRVLPTGLLEIVEYKKLLVKIPRGFELDPSGKWLVVGGQESNNIQALEVDSNTGKLITRQPPVPLSSPVCILFQKS